LRTYGQMATPLSAFFSMLLCIIVYAFSWYIGKLFSTIHYLKKV